ncbi:MAG: polyprenyl synthetase family protein [Calditrichaeota bacterium]|nr:polyprenyl synthetase family protein [Calditrichota bacterium]RQW06959.1 MAG: polyprenyl synthetase family protein [Calditrichota bacterium]
MTILQELAPLIQNIQTELHQSVTDDLPLSLRDPILYFLESPGKKIRPLLTLLACEAVDGEVREVMPAAVGIELFHDFTLIHDDIMDKDDMRRGRFTVHRKWGDDAAILVGDLLVGLAYKKMLECQPEYLEKVLNLFNETLIKVCEGQALDKEFEKVEHVSLDAYIDMISKKTAWLFQLSAQLGALLGGASEEQVREMAYFGYSLGIGFQIQDDWLDYAGEETALGKKVGSDLKMDKKTYVALSYAELIGQTPELAKKYPARISSFDSIPRLKEALFEIGIAAATESVIEKYISDALQTLSHIKPLEESNRLYRLVQFLRQRQS